MKTEGEQVDQLVKELEQDEGSFGSMRIALQLFRAGYRLDPYPNGKSKPELIARIEALEAERDRARELLRKATRQNVAVDAERFLAETSTVKP